MRLILRLIKWSLGAYVTMTLAMLAWTFLWPEPDFDDIQQSDVIVCLGGGMAPDGTLAPSVLTRVDRCVELYGAGLAPQILFSGGTARAAGPSAGDQMMRYAATLGVPAPAMVSEPRAQSTLHNALFSLGMVPNAQNFIIVTEAFHLPRAAASFHWARWEQDASNPITLQLVMSEPVRTDLQTGGVNWHILFRESLAIWFNIARAAAYSIAPDPALDWLH